MRSKVHSPVISSSILLAFALIAAAGIIPTTFENILAQSESWDINEVPGGSSLGNDTETTSWSDLHEIVNGSQPQEYTSTDGEE